MRASRCVNSSGLTARRGLQGTAADCRRHGGLPLAGRAEVGSFVAWIGEARTRLHFSQAKLAASSLSPDL